MKKREKRIVNHICPVNDYRFLFSRLMTGDEKSDFISHDCDVNAHGDECESRLCAGAHGHE